MAKSEPTKNYEDAIQKSSPKPFKNFKDIANSNDFFAFFESRFKLIESQVENRQPYKLFKVAEKETLTFTFFFIFSYPILAFSFFF